MSALQGVRVLELGQFYMGPYCTTLLARLGAEVIKVEAPGGDPYRRLPTVDKGGVPLQFSFMNSGKESVGINLKNKHGQSVLRDLAQWADVLVQNLAPGAMERFGLSWDTLHELNPRLIVASGSGFGSFGPYAGQPAMDLTVQARTAVMSTTGFPDGSPVRTGPSIVDFVGGAHLAAGVLAALYQRTVTGEGQHVEVALQDAILPALTSNIAGHLASSGEMPERTGNRHGGMAVAPYNAYETRDGWMTVLCPTNAHWERLREVIKDARTDNESLTTLAGRCEHMDLIDTIVSDWTSQYTKAELREILDAANIPCAEVVSLPELLEDPHVKERGVIREISDEQGSFMTLGSPLLLSDSPIVEPRRIRDYGQDTDHVLADKLEYSREKISEHRATGAIH